MDQYQGINCWDGPVGVNAAGQHVTGLIMVPENIPHYYLELPPGGAHKTVLQVVAVGVDSQGNLPPDAPAAYRAPGYKPHGGNPATAKNNQGIALIQAGLKVLQS